MYLMYLVIAETLHMRACAHAHTGVCPNVWYIRYIQPFGLMRG
ncbi:hypothetical protein BJ997_004072 [Cryobacterium roopkundense]|uniref:Uncharacterized protein n=1 Tax=Cryobacterium roopkundense TaxID=1001240 RepID=A0A7W9E6K9_9MICO|nr:hypothetical protein [Cryobacterium roopkundense]